MNTGRKETEDVEWNVLVWMRVRVVQAGRRPEEPLSPALVSLDFLPQSVQAPLSVSGGRVTPRDVL